MVLFKSTVIRITHDIGLIYIPLWSYSNVSIKSMVHCAYLHLHSTMVLFKLRHTFATSYLMQFTFHYGPIQIYNNYIIRKEILIYIPLWSYSNKKYCEASHKSVKFTFHYGPIQINISTLYTNMLNNLHSTMVLFKLILKQVK